MKPHLTTPSTGTDLEVKEFKKFGKHTPPHPPPLAPHFYKISFTS